MAGKNYRDLIAWQKSMDFVEAVYRATAGFPKEELYGLVSQLRRCSVSIPSNIAEGQGRGSDPDFARLLWIAHGSVREAETQVLIAARLGFISSPDADRLLRQASEIGRLITGLRKSISPEQE
jgi:four helix bundle protein